jgi:ubiquinone/menaquinone biosynthesis C-methylase UbiE
MEKRKREEVEVCNQRELDKKGLDADSYERKYSNLKYYSIARQSKLFMNSWFAENCSGKIALDYCCGVGGSSLAMARSGAFVYGIDISDGRIKAASESAMHAGLTDRVRFSIMDAENTSFEENIFDVILCSGVLHHLDIDRAYRELARVVKPSGKVICHEPLAYNPLINIYRKMTPHLRTSWETEHILTLREVRQAKCYFENINIKYFQLASILAVPFRKSSIFEPMLSFLEFIDLIVLKVPYVQRLAWQIVFTLSGPRK